MILPLQKWRCLDARPRLCERLNSVSTFSIRCKSCFGRILGTSSGEGAELVLARSPETLAKAECFAKPIPAAAGRGQSGTLFPFQFRDVQNLVRRPVAPQLARKQRDLTDVGHPAVKIAQFNQ